MTKARIRRWTCVIELLRYPRRSLVQFGKRRKHLREEKEIAKRLYDFSQLHLSTQGEEIVLDCKTPQVNKWCDRLYRPHPTTDFVSVSRMIRSISVCDWNQSHHLVRKTKSLILRFLLECVRDLQSSHAERTSFHHITEVNSSQYLDRWPFSSIYQTQHVHQTEKSFGNNK